MTVVTSSVHHGSTSATFQIPRKCTIPSDNKPHKVTVSIIPLTVDFTYTVIACLSEQAYLRATTKNTSEYPLLPGDMNIFMDNYFVATSSIKHTSPQEQLDVFLGADAAIKVTFQMFKITGRTGTVFKKFTTETFKHTTTIKNNKPYDVVLALFDQLPKSRDERIKVKNVLPDIKEDKSIELNEFHNLKWQMKLKQGEEKKVDLEYTIEFPIGESILID